MKKFSDYQGEEAIELWADLLEPIALILADKEIKNSYQSGEPKLLIAKKIINLHKAEAVSILTRIDPTPINGLNLITRLLNILSEIEETDELKDFFDTGEQAKTEKESSGSVTANTGAKEK